MKQRISISTPDHVTLEFELAGLGSRFAAYLIDTLCIGLLVLFVGVAITLTGLVGVKAWAGLIKDGSGWLSSWNLAFLIFVTFLIFWGYYVFFEGLKRGSTPGKKCLGIRVLRNDGLPIGFPEAALRNLVRAADMLPPPCYILGGVVIYLDPHGRRLGDMVAGTLVVVEKFEIAPESISGAAWAARIEQGGSRQGVALPRGAISAQQIALIEQFMARRHTLSQDRREAIAFQMAQPLFALLGEDRQTPRGSNLIQDCERLLLEILEIARTKGSRQAPISKHATQNPLF
jgi:uncharacterized RDD family membrane protein YckC